MLIDGAVLIAVFAAGYSIRAWLSSRRRRVIRKARGGFWQTEKKSRRCPQRRPYAILSRCNGARLRPVWQPMVKDEFASEADRFV